MRHWIATAALLLASTLHADSRNSWLIPAAGHLRGANGNFFRSDIAIHNLRDIAQRVRLDWLPRSESGAAKSVTISIPAGLYAQSDDFVFSEFSTEGLGAIVVTPVLADGRDDDAGRLALTSRIWTLQNGISSGDVSQSFPPVRFRDIVSTKLAIGGVRTGSQHRLNVGIVNLDREATHTFRITVEGIPSYSQDVAIAPASTQQVPITGVFGAGNLRVNVEALRAPGGGRLSLWTAYGSVVDNITGDSWSNLGVETTE